MSGSARAQAMSAACDRVVVGHVRASAVGLQVSHAQLSGKIRSIVLDNAYYYLSCQCDV